MNKRVLVALGIVFVLCTTCFCVGLIGAIASSNRDNNTSNNPKPTPTPDKGFESKTIADLKSCNKDLDNKKVETEGYLYVKDGSLYCYGTCSINLSSKPSPTSKDEMITVSISLTKDDGANTVKLPTFNGGISSFTVRDLDNNVIDTSKKLSLRGTFSIYENDGKTTCSLRVSSIMLAK